MFHLGLEGGCYSRFWKLKLSLFFFSRCNLSCPALSCSESYFKVVLGDGRIQGTDNGGNFIYKKPLERKDLELMLTYSS